ncbi:MAG: hypothetical protein ACLFM7_03680 [Bacteroidales bacterium]
MKKLLFITLLALVVSTVHSQDYKTAIGVRGTFISGITVKHFINEDAALEGIFSFGRWGMNVTGLYEKHARAFDVEGLNWYYGAGGHLGSWNDDYPLLKEGGEFVVIGVDGVIGLEYKVQEIPISFSVDYKPQLNFTGYPGFWGYGGALSIRYTF